MQQRERILRDSELGVPATALREEPRFVVSIFDGEKDRKSRVRVLITHAHDQRSTRGHGEKLLIKVQTRS